jgi:DNA helicase-2/ATP-dependent DNA helicase PcrA
MLVGFAFGMIPHHRSIQWSDEEKTQYAPESIEEERRLAYVGITRAKEQLYLSWPLQHTTRLLQRTPFLREMPSLAQLPEPETPAEEAAPEKSEGEKPKRKPRKKKGEEG